MGREPAGYYELRDALAQKGCPLCVLSVKAVTSYIDSILYEGVNDFGLRERLNRSRGFCHRHAWQMLGQVGRSLGIAIIQQDVLRTLLHALTEQESARRGHDIARALAPQERCPVCRHQEEMEAIYMQALLHLSEEDPLWARYRNSAGLCLPHFQRVMVSCRERHTRRRFIEAQRHFWQRLDAELAEFIRKNDYRFRHEGFGAEGDAWQRAIAQVVGHKDL